MDLPTGTLLSASYTTSISPERNNCLNFEEKNQGTFFMSQPHWLLNFLLFIIEFSLCFSLKILIILNRKHKKLLSHVKTSFWICFLVPHLYISYCCSSLLLICWSDVRQLAMEWSDRFPWFLKSCQRLTFSTLLFEKGPNFNKNPRTNSRRDSQYSLLWE